MVLEKLKELASKNDPLDRIIIFRSLLEIFEAFEANIAKEFDVGGTASEQINKITESMHIRELINLTRDQVRALEKAPYVENEGFWQEMNELLSEGYNKQ